MVKKGEVSTLTARERRFAQLAADPQDARSIGDKGIAAGWKDCKYGYKIMRRERVAKEIERVVAEHVRALRARVARVLSALADKAEDGDIQASKLFLEAAGVLNGAGVLIQNNVTATATPTNESLEDRIARLQDEVSDEGRAARIAAVRARRLPPIPGRFHGVLEDGENDD